MPGERQLQEMVVHYEQLGCDSWVVMAAANRGLILREQIRIAAETASKRAQHALV